MIRVDRKGWVMIFFGFYSGANNVLTKNDGSFSWVWFGAVGTHSLCYSYSIWKERNYRIFNRFVASLDDLLDVVCYRIGKWVI